MFRMLDLNFILKWTVPAFWVWVSACGNGGDFLNGSLLCEGYSNPLGSDFVLPYTSGESYRVSQGNCGDFTHSGVSRFAYDFKMEIGTTIRAAREGVVFDVVESFSDGNGGEDANYVAVLHSDETIGLYVHLTQAGALVSLGQSVNQGDAIALSGNTGFSTAPHLHFEVRQNSGTRATLPVTFADAPSGMHGLSEDIFYAAQ